MPGQSLDSLNFAIVVAGALLAGFASGFAGFGTGLVAAGFWFHALPSAIVPPLIVLQSVAGQVIGMIVVRRSARKKKITTEASRLPSRR